MKKCEICGKELYHSKAELVFWAVGKAIESTARDVDNRLPDEYGIIDQDGNIINETIFLCKEHGNKHLDITINTLIKIAESIQKGKIKKQSQDKKTVIETLKNEQNKN